MEILDTEARKIIKEEMVGGIVRARERILEIDKGYPETYIYKIMKHVIQETLGVKEQARKNEVNCKLHWYRSISWECAGISTGLAIGIGMKYTEKGYSKEIYE